MKKRQRTAVRTYLYPVFIICMLIGCFACLSGCGKKEKPPEKKKEVREETLKISGSWTDGDGTYFRFYGEDMVCIYETKSGLTTVFEYGFDSYGKGWSLSLGFPSGTDRYTYKKKDENTLLLTKTEDETETLTLTKCENSDKIESVAQAFEGSYQDGEGRNFHFDSGYEYSGFASPENPSVFGEFAVGYNGTDTFLLIIGPTDYLFKVSDTQEGLVLTSFEDGAVYKIY